MTDNCKFVPISGPGVDALEYRKESDNGPSEHEATEQARHYFRKYGPQKWPHDLIKKVLEMGREKSI